MNTEQRSRRPSILDLVQPSVVDSLIESDSIPCVSIYLPMERAGPETRQNRIRLKNALDQAGEKLVAHGLRRPEAEALLSEARELLDFDSFWQHQEDGLALFIAPDRTEHYRLAVPFRERVVVGDGFAIKPLLQAVTDGERFAVLAISRGEVRLLGGNRQRLTEIALPADTPQSLDEAMWYLDEEKQLQHRAMGRTGRGTVAVSFHGHGAPDENVEERDVAFLRAVDAAVVTLLDPYLPLVLAGVEEIVSLYRSISKHRRITEAAVFGNPDETKPDRLHGVTWGIVEPLFRETRDEDRSRIESGDGVRGIESALPASTRGQVAALFVSGEDVVWGRADEESGEVTVHREASAGDRDLLDVAAARAWSTGARVHVVRREAIPGDELAAAVLRY